MRRWCSLAGAVAVAVVFGISTAGAAVFYAQGPRDKKALALTFDDGPGPWTERILAVLAKYNVKATFFMEGSQVEFRGALAKKVAADGHEIGNHTYSHMNFYAYKKTDWEQTMAQEIVKSGEFIHKATGKVPTVLRMPHGYSREGARSLAAREGYTLVNWTFGCDWNRMNGQQLRDAYVKNIKSGAILLMHDGGKNRASTLEALPYIIEEARKQGYALVTVSELLSLKGGSRYAASPGKP